MANLIDQGKAAFDARLQDLERARKAVETEAETLASDLQTHIASHVAEVEAAKARLVRVAGEAAGRVESVPALVLSAESKARGWVWTHWRDVVLAATLMIIAAYFIRHA